VVLVRSDRIRDTFATIDRRGFLPLDQRALADEDCALPIGHAQTNSQPRTVADMLELLDSRPGDRVLDVGSGSGWTTALLAHLVGPTGRVIGVELVPELARWGARNLAGHDLPWATIEPADPAVLGQPSAGPFDRILVSAGADELPADLVDQLAPGGRMVIPVAGQMLVIERRPDGEVGVSGHGYYSFVPLLTPRPRHQRRR
jgi:protein-L-isoaspartate(D-aspartate) O-methyltransferase